MNYWLLDHWAYAFVWALVIWFMIRMLLGGRRLW